MHGATGHPKYGLILWEARRGQGTHEAAGLAREASRAKQPSLWGRRPLRGKNGAAVTEDEGDTLILHPLPTPRHGQIQGFSENR